MVGDRKTGIYTYFSFLSSVSLVCVGVAVGSDSDTFFTDFSDSPGRREMVQFYIIIIILRFIYIIIIILSFIYIIIIILSFILSLLYCVLYNYIIIIILCFILSLLYYVLYILSLLYYVLYYHYYNMFYIYYQYYTRRIQGINGASLKAC